MSNFFKDFMNVESFIYSTWMNLFGGAFSRLTRPQSGASSVVPGVAAPPRPGMRPPQRPGMPAAPQRPGTPPAQGAAPQRPGAPAPQRPAAGAPGPRPPAAPQRPGMPPGMPAPNPNRQLDKSAQGAQLFGMNINNLPQIPGLNAPPSGKGNAVQTRAEQETYLLKARGMNFVSQGVHRSFSQMYTNLRSFFERRA
ncbi:MAG: hypothetical protein KME03_15350 [Aphanocapsa lilacina HA4352-LM1]|jgi:hypothetical protein|nr:hypothetical protein [Aphanocapsa lilacina HA4352-LM1]